MSSAPWATPATTYDDRIDDPPDLQPTGIVLRQADNDLAPLAALADAKGPRSPRKLVREAEQLGQLLGEQAFYSWRQGGKMIEGPTIKLMDALAVMWGRLISSVRIVDQRADSVHLRGRVVDLLTLTAIERDHVQALMPPPGKFADNPEQRNRWSALQLQSASSKAIRTTLEHAMPAYLVEAAMRAAKAADARDLLAGKTLPEARRAAVEHLQKAHQLTQADLEAWVDSPLDLWTTYQLGELRELVRQLTAGAVAVDEVRAHAQAVAAAGSPAQAGSPGPQQAAAGPADRLADVRFPGPAPAPQAAPQPEPEPEPAPAPASASEGEDSGAGGEAPAAPSAVDSWDDPPSKVQAEQYRAQLRGLRLGLGEERWQAVREACGVKRLDKASPRHRWQTLLEAAQDEARGDTDTDTDTDTDDTLEVLEDVAAECGDLERSLYKVQGGVDRVRAARESSGCPKIDGAPLDALQRYRDALLDQVDQAVGGAS